jgi:hypothetical protein
LRWVPSEIRLCAGIDGRAECSRTGGSVMWRRRGCLLRVMKKPARHSGKMSSVMAARHKPYWVVDITRGFETVF